MSSVSTVPNRLELIPYAGYVWTLSQDVVIGSAFGEIDIKDMAFYGGALDINLAKRSQKTGQLRLLYRRSDSEAEFRSALPTVTQDIAVEYLHIGGVGGYQRGNVMPFTSITLGTTRFSGDGGDDWKFSMIFGLGVKVYTEGRVGFMFEGSWPITFTDAYGGVSFGTGGVSPSIGGTGISQLDVGGGVIIKL
jgi:hypothetical protein